MKKAEEKTNAIRLLEQKKLVFATHNYVQSGAVSGMEVASALDENPDQVFKTLVTVGKSGRNYVFLVPVSRELDLKKAAAAVHEKSIAMIKTKDLLPLTGYVHGGCSPIGMKKNFPTVIDDSAKHYETILFSGGKIGFQIEISLDELKKALDFRLEEVVEVSPLT